MLSVAKSKPSNREGGRHGRKVEGERKRKTEKRERERKGQKEGKRIEGKIKKKKEAKK